MATVVETTRVRTLARAGEQRILLRGISWQTYEMLCREIGDRQRVCLAYDGGDLELMSPHPLHDRLKKLLGRLVEDVVVALDIPCEAAGSARWTRETAQRGLEADEAFFLAPEKLAIVGGRPADRPDDPLPDLAIEVDLSDPAIDRASIYAALRVPEVWRFDGDRLRIDWLRDDGTFEEQPESRFLPIRSEEIENWVRLGETLDFTAWVKRLGVWIREEIVPRQVHRGQLQGT